MNFISWNKAYCLYPYATLEKSRSLISRVDLISYPRFLKALGKYSRRGFSMIQRISPDEDVRCAFRPGPRFVCDRNTWIMSLDTNGVQTDPHTHPSPDFDQHLLNGWEMRVIEDPNDVDVDDEDVDDEDVDDEDVDELGFYLVEMHLSVVRSSIKRCVLTSPASFLGQHMFLFRDALEEEFLEHANLSAAEPNQKDGKTSPAPGFQRL
jgi:hypothetical protein